MDVQQRQLVKDKKRTLKIIIIIAVIILLMLFCTYQNQHLVVSYYSIENPKITDDLKGFRIVHLSDVHNASFGKDNERLVNNVKELKPDIIVITGDLCDSNHANVDVAINLVNQLVLLAPVYYVTGNHEYWLEPEDMEKLINAMDMAGAIYLSNEVSLIEVGNASFELIGLEDNSLLDDTLMGLSGDGYEGLKIVLAHEPQYLERYSRTGVDVVLSGHAHGGQFILPFAGGVIAPGQGLFPKYTSGVHRMNNTEMIISRGLGNSVVPVRLFNYPEIVCIDLN